MSRDPLSDSPSLNLAPLGRWLTQQLSAPGLRWRRGLAALLLGAVTPLAQAPFFVWPILLLALPGLVWLMDQRADLPLRARMKSFAWLGFAYGMGSYLSGLYWLATAVEIAGTPAPLAPLAAVGVALMLAAFSTLALVVMAWGWLAQWPRLLFFALVWTVFEGLRGHLFTGFPWNLYGYAFGGSDVLIQHASWAGAYGLTLVMTGVALLPALAFSLPGWRRGAGLAASLMVMAGLWGLGTLRLPSPEHRPVAEGVVLRLVQANIAQEDKWAPENRAENFITYLRLTAGPGIDNVTHVIWPETAVPYILDREPSRTVQMARAAEGAMILTGAVRYEGTREDPDFFNSLHVIGPEGRILETYDKHHLVPFGEYLPLGGLLRRFGIEQLVIGGSYTPGPGPRRLPVPGAPEVGPLICYEAIFPGAVVGPERPGWLVNVTNDAWYGISAGPHQHLAHVRFRAVEEGLPLVRVAGSGISAVFDSWGREWRRLDLNRRGVIDTPLPATGSATLYSQWGNGIPVLILLICLGIWLFLRLGSRENRR